MKNIEVGTEVTGNWGAMFATSEGVVVSIKEADTTYLLPDHGRDVEILWNGRTEVDFCRENDIHEEGYRSVNGSPIGVFIK